MNLVLPWPPSVNAMWRTVVIKGAGRTLLSAESREYRDTVHRVVTRLGWSAPLTGRLRVSITARPPNRIRRDLDNLLKGPLDALKHARVFEDDSQIDDLHIVRGHLDEQGTGLLFVAIEQLPELQPSLPIKAPAIDPLSSEALA